MRNLLPTGFQYRELWQAKNINGLLLPTSAPNGQLVTLTGASKQTTCDGVHFTGAATSNINCGAIHNASAKLWVSFRFKFDQTFDSSLAVSQDIFGKWVDADNRISVYFDDNTGYMRWYMKMDPGAAVRFDLLSATSSWTAGVWYHVLASYSDTGPTQRLLIDNVLEDSDTQAAVNGPNGGNFTIGDRDDPGLGVGFEGVITDFFCGTDDLSAAEETDLYNGIPPADVVNEYLLDEGRGTTANDRGSGGNNGTLDTSCTWAWGLVREPVLSLDSLNDRGQSAAGVDISGALTLATIVKAKSTYNGLAADRYLVHAFIDASNELRIYFDNGGDVLRFHAEGGATSQVVDYATKPSIDDYLILLLTLDSSNVLRGYVNGSLVDSTTGVGVVSAAAATLYIGAEQTPGSYGISKPLITALIDGAMDAKAAKDYSRSLKDFYNLPITI